MFAARFMKGTCIAPSRATRADAHQAKGVKRISIDKPYNNPAMGLATLRQAAPVDAASPLILPRCDLSGAASLIIMSKRGNAKIEVRFRTVNAANSPGYTRFGGKSWRNGTMKYATGWATVTS